MKNVIKQTREQPKRTLGIFCLAWALLFVPGVQADMISYPFNVPVQNTDWATPLSVPQFDPALGTLNSILFEIDGTLSGSLRAENTASSVINNVAFDFVGQFALEDTTPSTIISMMPSVSWTNALPGFDGIVDFAGLSGVSSNGLSLTSSNSVTSFAPLMLAAYTGTNAVSLNYFVMGLSQVVSLDGKTLNDSIFTQATGNVRITYDYTAIPEPTTFSLLAFAVFLLVRFRKSTSSS